MKNKSKLQQIEEEITFLSKKRTDCFNEWVYLVKKMDRDYEMHGIDDIHNTRKAETLLKEQRSIGKKIMRLLARADNLILD